MKIISIDTETTGIDKDRCQVIEIGAIIEDTENILSYEKIPKFECIVEWPEYTGSAFAINLNNRIFKILAKIDSEQFVRRDFNILKYTEVADKFRKFLNENGFKDNESINVAGKNFARFDWDFLNKLPNWNSLIKFSQRVIDPAILCVDWKRDLRMPNSNECKERSDLGDFVSHRAIEDAWDVIQVLRNQTVNYTI